MDGGDVSAPTAKPLLDQTMDGGDVSATTAKPLLDPPPASGGGETDASEGPDAHREGFEALARAIYSTLGAVMREFSARAEGVARSQDDLSRSLERLEGELDKLLEDAPLPFVLQYATKITSIRKRVSALNLTLKSIQRRIDSMDLMLSTGSSTTNNDQLT